MPAGNTTESTDLDIIRGLRDGRRSMRELAEELGVAENTVRSRVERMRSEGLLSITGLVDASQLEGHSIAFVGLRLSPIDPNRTTSELTAVRGVVSACLVAGRFDALLIVMLNEEYGLLQFYTELDSVQGLQATETFIVITSDSLVLPYVL